MTRQQATERVATGPAIAPEDVLRANTYGLLALLLRAAPDAEILSQVQRLDYDDDSEMGRALGALAAAARDSGADAIDDEFHLLFAGVGGSEINPYGSYHMTGFMYEKPLAKVRASMADLGIARADGTPEPEDHIAALCEMMCGLISGAFGDAVPLDRQRQFFDAHLAPWAERFFEQLETAESATFYGPVGTIGRLFMRIESQAFEMAA